MIIKKVFSNNAISALSDGQEVVLTGKGIGFAKKSGDDVDEEKIEKRFIPPYGVDSKFEKIMQTIPIEYLVIGEQIYESARDTLCTELHQQLVLDLADHISFAVERSKTMDMDELFLLDDIRDVYPREYAIGERAVATINSTLQLSLPKEEIGYIAFHIVNAEKGDRTTAPKQLMEFVKEVLDRFERMYPGVADHKDSFAYARFVVHLRFLGNRVLRKETFEPYGDEMLKEEFLKDDKLKQSLCDICSSIKMKFDYILSEQEQLYLLIHMKRILKENRIA